MFGAGFPVDEIGSARAQCRQHELRAHLISDRDDGHLGKLALDVGYAFECGLDPAMRVTVDDDRIGLEMVLEVGAIILQLVDLQQAGGRV